MCSDYASEVIGKQSTDLPAIPCNRRELTKNSHTPCQYDAMSGDARQLKVREAYLHVPRHELNNAILARKAELGSRGTEHFDPKSS